MREKLIELLRQCDTKCDEIQCEECPYDNEPYDCGNPMKADYLIANGVTISDRLGTGEKCTASLNFEAEYPKAMEEIQKAKYENEYLRDELRNAKQALSWYEAMKQTVEVIFGRKFEHG